MKMLRGVIRHAGLFPGHRFRAVLALAGSGLLGPASPAAQFEDVTMAAGLTDSGAYCFAAAWGDYDRDGFPDLFIAAGGSGSHPNLLYRNLGNGTFAPVGPEAGPPVIDMRVAYGCAWVDFNNDGWRDLLVSSYTGQDALYWNRGDGTFGRGRTGNLTSGTGFHSWAACADYDADGWVDVYLGEADAPASAGVSRLYHATGHGTFEPVDLASPVTLAVSGAWGDFDNDGDLDLYTGNETSPSALWRNEGGGRMRAVSSGLPPGEAAAAAWADYDGDGDLDIALGGYSTNLRVYRNDGGTGFVRVTTLTGVGSSNTPVWADFDNDGYPDLLAIGGQDIPRTPRLHHNNGDGTFSSVPEVFTEVAQNWLGASAGDFDNDGFMDLVLTHQYGKNRLYHNRGNANHWIKVQLTGTVSNRDAIGAKVRLQATIGGQVRWQMQEVSAGSQGQNDIRLNFGLGDATKADLVRIEWPSGNAQELANVAADQMLSVTETVPITPKRIVANPNGTAIFIRSGEAVSRQWQFEGVNLAGQTNARLTLTNVTLAQQGRYSLVADTGAGMETNYTYLAIDPHFSKVINSPVVTDKVVSWAGHFGDLDGDGWLDLLVEGDYGAAGQNTRLYRNTGGQFSPVTTGPWANLTDLVGPSAWADVDNDGDLDVLLGVHESQWPFYMRNDGGGAFTRLPVNKDWIQPPRQVGGWTCAWADINRDGLLDAMLSGGSTYPLLNRGDGTFTILTNTPMAQMRDWPQGVVFVDYDNDGDADVFLPGETGPGRLCRNEGGGRFTDVSGAVLQSRVDPGLGGAFGDFDNDGDWDLFTVGVFNGQMREAFLVNNGDGTFSNWDGEPKAMVKLDQGSPFWGDYDNDGLLDLFIAKVYGGRCQLFRNQGEGNFLEITSGTLLTDTRTTHSAALADYNNDGTLDVFLACRLSSGNYLYENHGHGHHWLKVRLKGTASNSHGIGARVLVTARTGTGGSLVRQMRQISAGSLIQELEAHFGLGTAPGATLLRIKWPSGTVQEITGIKADQILTVWEPPVLRAAVQTDGSCLLTLRAEPNRPWQVQASSDLVAWETLATVTPTTVASTYTDPTAGAAPQRFYRVSSP